MIQGRKNRQFLFLLCGFVLGAVTAPVLSACVQEESSLVRAIEAFRSQGYQMSDEAIRELGRFGEVYQAYSSDPRDSRPLRHFRDAYVRVRVEYVEDVGDAELIDAAIEGVLESNPKPGSVPSDELVQTALDAMVGSLDPHSTYLDADELRDTFVSTRGQFGGLGIEVTMEEGAVKVISPIEGTPAERAGLQSGDLITHLDGEPVGGNSITEAVKRMRGAPGSEIRLTVDRAGETPFDVSIVRDIITVRAVRWRTEGDIGYIRVASFTEQVNDGLRDAIDGIHKELGASAKGLVLDLRNNPGGLLDQSLFLADAFLDHGRIVSVKGRESRREQVYDAQPGDLAEGLPMVVLINGGSASASEIVANALQEDDRAIVMGTPSFGKGSVQVITPLPVEGALKLTTALYYGPSGRTIQAFGVTPDILIKPEEGLNREREADQPGALRPRAPVGSRDSLMVNESDCPAAGDAERPDRTLGCALALLEAGSPERFLTAVSASGPM